MEIQPLWLLILGAATPIAGVVGFAIQLRQVKKIRLENEKLQLEIAALKLASEQRSQMVRAASMEEIERYGRNTAVFSRSGGPNPGPSSYEKTNSLREWLTDATLLALVVLVLAYAIYDVFRLTRWVIGLL